MDAELQKPDVLCQYPLVIHNFVYNGFYCMDRQGYAKYTGKFIKWTNDPGIFEAECSDGKLRLIPSCCIDNYENSFPTEPNYTKMKEEGTFLYFGYPSHS